MRQAIFLSACLFGLAAAALADDQATTLPGNGPVPVQSFEQAGSADPSPASTPAPAPAPAPATSAAPADTATIPADAAVSTSTLKSALLQLNKNFTQYQQQNDAKMLILGAQVSTNTADLARLDKALALLNQEVTAATPGLVKTTEAGSTWFNYWERHFNAWIGVVAGLIILFIGLVFFRKARKAKPGLQVEADDTETEYDYMGSAESMPAKLNLAHAYIKMENFNGAKEVLEEVIQKGTEEQKVAAKELLKKCS